MDKKKKRSHENSESNSSVQGDSKLLKSDNHNSHVQRVNSSVPYFCSLVFLSLLSYTRNILIEGVNVKTLCTLSINDFRKEQLIGGKK